MAHSLPKVTFGVIVLNGEPFVPYTLRSLYPFAHQIIVVEGAAPAAAGIATASGHSTDGTLDALRRFQTEEDPEGKVIVVTAEDEGHPNGFWPGEKDEQSKAYAKRAKGQYLWQVDIDEFYHPKDVAAVLTMLHDDPEISHVSFKQITFWGNFNTTTDSYYLRSGAEVCPRLFIWGSNFTYASHRPVTVCDGQGRDVASGKRVHGELLASRGIYFYHYSLLFPKQVIEKCEYYGTAEWAKRSGAQRWAQEAFMDLRRPFRVHNVYTHVSWLERFRGSHPPEIERMRADILSGRLDIAMRPTADVDALLASPLYRAQRAVLKASFPLYQWWHRALRPGTTLYRTWRPVRRILRKVRKQLPGAPKKPKQAKYG